MGKFDKLHNVPHIVPALENMTENVSYSYFSETWSDSVRNTLVRADVIGEALETSTLANGPFENPTTQPQVGYNPGVMSTSMGESFDKVARLISQRAHLGRERDVFHVSLGSFDSHGDPYDQVAGHLENLDSAIA